MAADGGHRGVNSAPALPSEPCPHGSGRQEDAAIPHHARTCLPTPPQPAGPTRHPVLLVWGDQIEQVS